MGFLAKVLAIAVSALGLLSVGLRSAGAAGEAVEEPRSPKAAFEALTEELQAARSNPQTFRGVQAARSKEVLAALDQAGGPWTGEDRLFLARIRMLAGDAAGARADARAALRYPDAAADVRGPAMEIVAQTLVTLAYDDSTPPEALRAAAEEVEMLLPFLAGDELAERRAMLHQSAGRAREQLGDEDAAIDHYMRSVRARPELAASVSGSIANLLLHGVWRMEEYEPLRARAKPLLDEVAAIHRAHLESIREGGDARAVGRAEQTQARLESAMVPFEMLGRPIPAFTLVKAYGDVQSFESLKGQVVLVDFWATWCGWCIRSFPTLRDLRRDYEDKGFAILGVTAPAGYVTEANYNLDEDMKGKLGSAPAPAVHRLPQGAAAEETAAFRETEKATIATFLENHEIPWDVVMIDAAEPSAKYALTGWPHAILLDREGRVRAFKRGALLRERPEQVAEFRKLLESLLADKS